MTNDINRARDALNHIDAGCARDEWVRAGMAAKSAGLSLDDFHNWSATGGNYVSESDCWTVWKSFKDGAVTPASLFGMAFAQGWKDQSKSRTKQRPAIPMTVSVKAPAKAVKQAASASAIEVWERCILATPAEPYINRKQGKPDGVRVYPASAPPLVIRGQNVAGCLVVPCWSSDKLQTLQFIPPENGDKLNLPDAKFNNGYFMVGDIAKRISIVEGIGQAWAVNQASGEAAVCCFGAGRMATVAKVLRAKYPSAVLVIIPDKGKEKQAAKIAADVSGEWVAMPADKPDNYDCNDLMQEKGVGALAELLTWTTLPPLPLSVAFADDLPDNFVPPDELVEGVITACDGSILYGDSNSGKTFFVIDMACAIARGVDWMGRKTEQGLVLYLAAESPSSVRRRLQAYQNHHGLRVPNFAIVQSPIDLFIGDADTDAIIQTVRMIEQQRGVKVRLIIGDTLARLSAGANENAGQDMGLVVRRFDRIRSECQAHFMMIHHNGKNIAAGARGWSGVRAAVDTEIEVTASTTHRCAEITKQRDLPTKGERIGFELEKVELGQTKWGKPATSCVVVAANAPDKSKSKSMTVSQRQGMSSYHLAAASAGILDADGKFVGLHLESWRYKFYEISTADSQDAKKKAFQRVRDALVGRGDLSVSNDIYRLAGELSEFDENLFAKELKARQPDKTGQTKNDKDYFQDILKIGGVIVQNEQGEDVLGITDTAWMNALKDENGKVSGADRTKRSNLKKRLITASAIEEKDGFYVARNC